MRRVSTHYLREDPEHPEWVTSTFQSPAYTPEDQALLMGLEAHEHSLKHDTCNCGHPKSVAWHSDMAGGWFEKREYVCYACSARTGRQVTYTFVVNTRPASNELPPFVLGQTTESPS